MAAKPSAAAIAALETAIQAAVTNLFHEADSATLCDPVARLELLSAHLVRGQPKNATLTPPPTTLTQRKCAIPELETTISRACTQAYRERSTVPLAHCVGQILQSEAAKLKRSQGDSTDIHSKQGGRLATPCPSTLPAMTTTYHCVSCKSSGPAISHATLLNHDPLGRWADHAAFRRGICACEDKQGRLHLPPH